MTLATKPVWSLRDILWSVTVLPLVYAQNNVGDVGQRSPDDFQWIQPENTTILGQYGDSQAVYPSPNMTGHGGWEGAFQKAQDFISEMTLDEKVWLVTGAPGPCIGNINPIPRLNFSGLCLQDGPNGVRMANYVSVFSSGITIASSWDRELFYRRYHAMGRYPVAGPLGRSPYGGRNWEGFSPDPYLTGVAMEQAVQGIQDAGVQATVKHWLLYEQETARDPVYYLNGTLKHSTYSSNADDRTVHEVYMWPFANAIRAHASSVMCSYNRVNGSYACQNSNLLNGLLKTELGFQGYVMTDWEGLHSGLASIEAGADMDQPGFIAPRTPVYGDGYQSYFGYNVSTAIKNGTLSEARLNDMAARILTPYYFLRQGQDFPSLDPAMVLYNNFFSKNEFFGSWNLSGSESRDVRSDHGDLIRRQAAESTILLKNKKNALPLKAPKNIGLFGNDILPNTQGALIRGTNEFGTLAIGGGSGNARFTYLVTPLEAIQRRAAQDGALVQFWANNTLVANSNVTSLWVGHEPDACLIFLKTRASERLDRGQLYVDWNGDAVVASVAKSCSNTIVVTHSGGLNTIPWADHPNVTAILLAHYPGQESGNSIVDVLYGQTNPSGRLPYTIPRNASDVNTPPTTNVTTLGVDDWQSWYTEGLEIDYRYYDAHNISVQYEFGFGLSYTSFELSDLNIRHGGNQRNISSAPQDLKTVPGGNPALWEVIYEAEATVRNTEDVTGSTVVQLYISFPDSVSAPPRQLRGFEKVEFSPGERRTLKFNLMRRDISYWDVVEQQWLIPTGEFVLHAAFSSRDIASTTTFNPLGTAQG
ncbi:glycoside hydrolase superfamily [Ilyonectria sp. MPI-CAGE-AT-0026]|nr:glycoside hydrolase superfamily [Ilyonectria sp. MPI-CAGE-AT-0026]